MSKIAQIKKNILEARKKGDAEREIRLLEDLLLLQKGLNFPDPSVQFAYGLTADSP